MDVVITRTLVSGGVTATLAMAISAGVLLLQFALQPPTSDSQLAIVGSTIMQPAQVSLWLRESPR